MYGGQKKGESMIAFGTRRKVQVKGANGSREGTGELLEEDANITGANKSKERVVNRRGK